MSGEDIQSLFFLAILLACLRSHPQRRLTHLFAHAVHIDMMLSEHDLLSADRGAYAFAAFASALKVFKSKLL